jgi:hypothetical protein
MEPDVVVTYANQTTLFRAQNKRASDWLRRRCHLTVENASGDTEIRVHPNLIERIIKELKTAGFEVSVLKSAK